MEEVKNQQTVPPQTIPFKAYPKSERVNEDETEIIKLNAKGPRLVHDMVLNYKSIFDNLDSIQTKSLHRPLEKLKLINALFLSLSEADLSKDMILQNLSQRMKSLSSLQILKLKTLYVSWISLQGVKQLSSALAQMKLLEGLTMNFSFASWVNDKCLHSLFKSLKKYKNLQSFHLDILHCENVTERSFKRLASTLNHSLSSLKELNFGFAGLNLPEGNALDFLASGLVNLKSLQTFRVNLPLQIGSVENFSSFLCSIKHLKSLRALFLDFSFIPINASVLKHLATSFESLAHLHTLSLSFEYCSTMTTQEMEILAQCLQAVASSLKNLHLNFSSCSNVNDQALEKLSVGLKALINLCSIDLRCEKSLNIGDIGVESVTSELGGLPNLSSVTLAFRGCRPINEAYHNGLKMNKNIKHLSFRS